MGANSKFHKIIGAAEIVVGGILDYYSFGTFGNSLILMGLATFEGVPGAPVPQASAQNLTLTSAITPLQILYGKTKVSGLLMAADSGDGGGATDADYKYLAVAHSLTLKDGTSAIPLYGVDADGNYYLDNNPIFTACVNATTGDISGSGSQGNLIDYDGIVQILTYQGDQTAVDPWLHAGLSYWLSTAIAKGVAYTVVKIHADPNDPAVQAAFPGGLPQQIAVDLQGQKVYDPRLDSSVGGSGTHRKNDPTTWNYKTPGGVFIGMNPALCLRDYLVRPISEAGAGIDPSVIPDDYLKAAADRCDDLLTIPNGSGGTTTEPRFQCSVGLVTSDSIPTNVQKLLDAMAGWMVETGGELRIFAGEYVAPVTTITADWLSGSPTFQTTAEQDLRWNTVNSTFTDRASAYSTVQTPGYAAPGAVTSDGGIVITKNLNLPAVSEQYQAQYITQISANQSREQQMLTLPCNLMALDVDCGEVVEVTLPEYGLSAATFRVTNWQRKGDSSILLTLQQAISTTFDDATFTEVDALGQPPLVDQVPPQPTGLTATGKVGGIALNWDDIAAQAFTYYEIYRSTTSGGSYTHIKNTSTSNYTDTVLTTTTYFYKVRAVNYREKVGAFAGPVSALAVNVTDVVGGTGPNLCPAKYSVYATAANKLPPFGLHTSLSFAKAASTAKYGSLCLQLTSTSGSVAPKLALVGNTSNANIALGPKMYTVQVWCDAPSDTDWYNFAFRFYNAGGSAACAAATAVRVPGLGGGAPIGVYAAELDLTGASSTDVYLEVDWLNTITSGHTFNIQGFAIFEMQGTSAVVPTFAPAPAASADDLQDGINNGTVLQTAFTDGSNQLDLSLAASDGGTGVEGIVKFDTANMGDSAGFSQMADTTKVSNLPATVAAAQALGMILDAQTALGGATAAREILRDDGAGNHFWDLQYQGECDGNFMGGSQFASGNQTLTGSYVQFGNRWRISGVTASLTIIAWAQLTFNVTATGANQAAYKIQISTDGGSTWTDSSQICQVVPALANSINAAPSVWQSLSASPTGDILIRVMVTQLTGAATISTQAATAGLGYMILASSNGVIDGGTLAVSIPGTRSMSCSATYPTTSCSTSATVSVKIPGGAAPFTPSTAKSAGTGTLSGTATTLVTVSDSENTANGGATHTTTLATTVQDSQTYSGCTATHSGSNTTITIAGGHGVPANGTFNTSGFSVGGDNGTGWVATSVTGTTIIFAGGAAGAATGGTVNTVALKSSNCVVTGTFIRAYSAVSVSISGTNPSGYAQYPASATAANTQTGNATGGDGSFTWSNSKPSGSYSLTGSTSRTPTVSETGAVPVTSGASNTDTGTLKMIATDGQTPANTGNHTKTITFFWTNVGN